MIRTRIMYSEYFTSGWYTLLYAAVCCCILLYTSVPPPADGRLLASLRPVSCRVLTFSHLQQFSDSARIIYIHTAVVPGILSVIVVSKMLLNCFVIKFKSSSFLSALRDERDTVRHDDAGWGFGVWCFVSSGLYPTTCSSLAWLAYTLGNAVLS